MDALIVPLIATALIPPLVYLAVSTAFKALRRRGEAKRAPKSAVLVMPAASETAAAVERFHRVLMRTDLADFLRPDSNSGA